MVINNKVLSHFTLALVSQRISIMAEATLRCEKEMHVGPNPPQISIEADVCNACLSTCVMRKAY